MLLFRLLFAFEGGCTAAQPLAAPSVQQHLFSASEPRLGGETQTSRFRSAVRFCVRVGVGGRGPVPTPPHPRVNTPWRRAERRRFGVSVGGDRPVGDLRYALSCRPRPLCSRFCGATANPFHRVFLFYIKARRNGSRSSALYVLAPQFVGGAKKLAGMKIRVRRSCSLR
jgi:hypothetical protein